MMWWNHLKIQISNEYMMLMKDIYLNPGRKLIGWENKGRAKSYTR